MLKIVSAWDTPPASQAARMRCLISGLCLLALCWGAALPALVAAQTPESGSEINEEEYAKDSTTEINVKNADIAAIVRIFSKKTKRNYILDERVKGKVSIYLPGKVSADESIRILDSVLAYKGFTAVPIGENLWKIVPAKEARQSTIPTLTDASPGKPSQSMVTRLVQLKYISTEEVKQLVSQLVSPDGLINAYQGTNSLLLIDNEDNIERLVNIIGNLDVPTTDREMTIIPIKHADAIDIANKLNELLGEGGPAKGAGSADSGLDLLRARIREVAAAASTAHSGGAPGGTGTAAGSAPGSPLMVRQPRIIADERTNSIIVVADEDTTARIRALISQLDSKIDLSGNRFYVYRCQHAKAEDLADVLSGLTGGGSGTTRTTTGGVTRSGAQGSDLISPFGRSSQTRSTRGSQWTRGQTRLPGQSLLSDQRGAASAAIGENISVTADPATNSLIIVASKADYEKLKDLLKELDIKRRQVIVEAVLLEVGLDDNASMGTSFIASGGGEDGAVIMQNQGNNIVSLLQNPAAIQNFSIAAASAGTLSIGDAIKIPTQTVLLNAARSNSNINILSAPTILTTDNEQAEIVVGQNVPFLSSTATSDVNLSNTFNQIDRQDVGITLRLTPQISSGDIVTLKIFTEVSSVLSTDPTLGPTTTIRTSETSVIAKDGQMIVMGGLISDDISEGDSGVPFLKDVPVLGHLFRTTIERHRRTNLLIMITPRIVKDQFDARDITIARRERLQDEIQERDLYPTRREVLEHADIDKVSESSAYDGPLPGTILAPKDNQAPQILEFKVNPPLPKGTVDKQADSQPPAADRSKAQMRQTAAFFTGTADDHQASAVRQTYVISKMLPNEKLPGNAPFSLSQEQSLVSLILPAEASLQAKTFFRVGGRYSYRLDQESFKLSPVGIFSSQEEAEQFYQGAGLNWYTLSPYEIMSLGQGPWLQDG